MSLAVQSMEQVHLEPPFTFGDLEFGLDKVYRLKGDIPEDLPVSDGVRFLFVSQDQRALTHGLHKYPAKFFPELPRWLIARHSNVGDTVLDPFMGSATTNIEAILAGRDSIGVDVDPFSRMLARVKTTPLPSRKLQKAWRSIERRVERYRQPNGFKGVPEFPYRDTWFRPFVLKELAHIKREILATDTTEAIKDFFLVNFSSIIRAVSEADNNCTRTVVRKSLGKQVNPGMAIGLFLKRAGQQVPNMLEFVAGRPQGKMRIPPQADARSMVGIADGSVDCAITSPPYANAVDYPRTHQLEMYWLGLADGSLRDLKSQHVGTEVVSKADYQHLHKVDCEVADSAIERIYDIDPRRAYIASKYLLDMFANLRETHRVLRPGGSYIIVVGNNLMRGVEFETWRYLRAKAPELGFDVDCRFISEIINHFIKVPRKERISCDHILVLRK